MQAMSREDMRGLKAKIEENARLQKVNTIVNRIYGEAVTLARTSLDTSFNYPIPPDLVQQRPRAAQARVMPAGMTAKEALFNQQQAQWEVMQANQGPPSDPFFLANMPDILSGLQQLFPDCTVTHSLLCQGTDGKLYDISTLDDKVLPFVNRALDRSFIVIDWS